MVARTRPSRDKEEFALTVTLGIFPLTATHTDKMGDAAVDTSTLCLFDVDGTLTAARQVVSCFCFVSKHVCEIRPTLNDTLTTLHSSGWLTTTLRQLGVTSGFHAVAFHASHTCGERQASRFPHLRNTCLIFFSFFPPRCCL